MVGRTISHYKILSELGRGGMGIVYKAEDIRLERTVALKFLSSSALEDDQSKARFIHEAKAAAALNHPNICTIHEIDEADGQLFIAMEYIEGTSVKRKVESRPLRLDEALDIAIQAAQGIHAAHRRGIVHRDIKSANTMVSSEGLTKVMDFGLAQLAGRTKLTKTGSSLGTPAYMSPEQARGEKVDHRSDIWSFGVMLYEMLTGQLPFKGEVEAAVTYVIVNEEPEPPTALRSGVPIELDRVINKALAKNREERYQHIDELLVDLRAVSGEIERARSKRRRPQEQGVQAPQEPVPSDEVADESASEKLSATSPAGAAPVARPIDLKLLMRYTPQVRVAIPTALVIVALCVAGWWFYRQRSQARWAQQVALPEIHRLVDQRDYVAAFHLAEEAESFIADDTALTNLWPRMSRDISFQTTPPGADVYVQKYSDGGGEWRHLGRSPLESVKIPLQYCRWRIVKDGFKEIEIADPDLPFHRRRRDDFEFELEKLESGYPGMVPIPATTFQRVAGALGELGPVELPAYWIDQFEVTNGQYKEFMDTGGYRDRIYWKHEFVKGGEVLSWEEAMKEFSDGTGRPGPSTWEFGSYPEGQQDYPVAGLGWYEAAAYAEFAGKALPTVYHWLNAEPFRTTSEMIPFSNFGGKSAAPVGTNKGVSAIGTYDMAGNVREWTSTSTGILRYILGGAWNEPAYLFTEPSAPPPFDRSPGNGLRCVKYGSPGQLPESLTAPVEAERRDYALDHPVPDEMFQVFRRLYSYDQTELLARVESTKSNSVYWTRKKITFGAAYGEERIPAYLFLPKNTPPPYQTIVYFPGASVETVASSDDLMNLGHIEPLTRSGRAVLYPIYKGTYERVLGQSGDSTAYLSLDIIGRRSTPRAQRDLVTMAARDVSRAVDYLESRNDIRHVELGYMGNSLGARLGILFLAIENRFQAAVLLNGGLTLAAKSLRTPEHDEINFAPQVRLPVLMINGRYDLGFPLDSSQRTLFRLLGSEKKKHKVLDRGHSRVFLDNDEIREILDWYDEHLGPI